MKPIILITLAALAFTFCFVEKNAIGIWFFAGFLSCMTGCAIRGFLKGRD